MKNSVKVKLNLLSGSGKTSAVLLPILSRLFFEGFDEGPGSFPLAIIISPTNALAVKVCIQIFIFIKIILSKQIGALDREF